MRNDLFFLVENVATNSLKFLQMLFHVSIKNDKYPKYTLVVQPYIRSRIQNFYTNQIARIYGKPISLFVNSSDHQEKYQPNQPSCRKMIH